MDLVKLSSVTAQPTEFSVGEHITGHTSALWVERYRDPGEFEIQAALSSNLISFLPIGSFITHLGTSAVMIVENHEIKQPKDEDPTIVISGRCLTTVLENRTVGDGWAFATNVVGELGVGSDETWDQALLLIDQAVVTTTDPDDALIGIAVSHTCSGTSTSEARTFKQGSVHDQVIEILKVDDLGLKVIRPTPTDPLTNFIIYRGDNVSTKVRFSWMRGDLDNVEYFFSNKKLKNQARVMGRWVQEVVNPTGANNYDRRTMIVDARDIDDQQTAYPAGGTLTAIIIKMGIRGRQALKAQPKISITQADVSDNANLRFRRDYDIGDLVTVDGDFGASTVMRVVEYAEAEDESGETGHPTLAIPGEY
jgi:hypothetical protein